MLSGRSETNDGEFFTGRTVTTGLALAYMGAGIGLFISIATGWTPLILAVFGGILVLVLVSLYIDIRRDGLVTAENKLYSVFSLLATGLVLALFEFTNLSVDIVFFLSMVVVGLPPYLIVNYTDYGTPASATHE